MPWIFGLAFMPRVFFVSSQFFSMILHKLSSLCLVLYSIFIIMLVNIIFWGMHLLWNSQCEYDKHFPAFIWFNFFLNVTKYDKENDSKRIDWNSPGIFVIACDQSGCWEQFHCQCDQGNSDEKWHWNRFGFHISFCNNNMTSVEFFSVFEAWKINLYRFKMDWNCFRIPITCDANNNKKNWCSLHMCGNFIFDVTWLWIFFCTFHAIKAWLLQ